MTTMTVPLRKSFLDASPKNKTNRAIRCLKSHLIRHCKVEEVRLGPHLNERLWARGAKNPPPRVTINVRVDEGIAKAELEGFDYQDVKREEKGEETLKDKITAKLGGSSTKAAEAPAKKPSTKTVKESNNASTATADSPKKESSSPKKQDEQKES